MRVVTPAARSAAVAQEGPAGPRQRVQPVHLAGPVTLKWISYDVKHQTLEMYGAETCPAAG